MTGFGIGGASLTTGGASLTTGGASLTTGHPTPACEALPGAPPPFVLDGVAHVPLDLRKVEAELVFNARARRSAAPPAL